MVPLMDPPVLLTAAVHVGICPFADAANQIFTFEFVHEITPPAVLVT